VLVSGFVDRLPALPELDAYIGDGCDVTGLAELRGEGAEPVIVGGGAVSVDDRGAPPGRRRRALCRGHDHGS
jgi:hypothetical protein